MPWPIHRLTAKGAQILDGGVVIEEPLEIQVDGRTVAVLMRTPGMEKELAAGFCLGEGLVAGMADVALIRHCGRTVAEEEAETDPLDVSRNRVEVRLMPDAAPLQRPEAAPPIRSGCGRIGVEMFIENIRPVGEGVRIGQKTLARLPAQVARRQVAYRAAGGIHAAALFDRTGQVIAVCEDVGRHNAVDKALGFCLLRGIPLDDKILLSTGRASYDMVIKGARLGVPLIASISSPTSRAVELAQALNCTLLGYLRGKTVNIYTHPWRITPDHSP